MRKFSSGATRNNDADELDYEGFFSPIVMKCFAEYMHENRVQTDGKIRDSDNWQKGISKNSYMKSEYRHTMDLWLEHRGYKSREGIIKALCGIMFNTQGYLFEILKEKNMNKTPSLNTKEYTKFLNDVYENETKKVSEKRIKLVVRLYNKIKKVLMNREKQ